MGKSGTVVNDRWNWH